MAGQLVANSDSKNLRNSLSFFEKPNRAEQNEGFSAVRKSMKHRIRFSKGVSYILRERARLEDSYSRRLQKLAKKLQKLCQEMPGYVSESWLHVGRQMENEGSAHKFLSSSLSERTTKPILLLVEEQSRIRKSIENMVESSLKKMSDSRSVEGKLKKECFMGNRQYERFLQLLNDTERVAGRGPADRNASEKHMHKLQTKARKMDNSLHQLENNYFSSCLRAERCRYDVHSAVCRAVDYFVAMERERQKLMDSAFQEYRECIRHHPAMLENMSRSVFDYESSDADDHAEDILLVKGDEIFSELLYLPDFYAEDLENPMDRDRRIQCLRKILFLLRGNIEKEEENLDKEGLHDSLPDYVETITRTMTYQPHGVSSLKLRRAKTMLVFLEATKYKMEKTLMSLEDRPWQPTASLDERIATHKDVKGIRQSILDAGEYEHVIHEEEEELPGTLCQALYDYSSDMPDELCFRAGDIIVLQNKLSDDWWQGKVGGASGIFPATYVEELATE